MRWGAALGLQRLGPRAEAALPELLARVQDPRAGVWQETVADNLRAGRTGLLPAGKRLFDALARLVLQVPVLEIHPDGDPAAMAPMILRSLEENGALDL